MTFKRQVPGPMLRVRRNDTVTLTLRNKNHSTSWHSIDLHAGYGPGGAAADVLTVLPGTAQIVIFEVVYPGAFTYHCAVPGEMDVHIASGMFGMIIVEPEQVFAPGRPEILFRPDRNLHAVVAALGAPVLGVFIFEVILNAT